MLHWNRGVGAVAALSATGQSAVISAGAEGQVARLDAASGTSKASFSGGRGALSCVAVSHGEHLAAIELPKRIGQWVIHLRGSAHQPFGAASLLPGCGFRTDLTARELSIKLQLQSTLSQMMLHVKPCLGRLVCVS